MLPKPFPIPRFRQSTESNFQKKILTDTDRKYVVQTLSTILMTYTQKVSMFHCTTVAKALIAKYDFLKDKLLKAEHLKSKPRPDVLKDLMTRTFANRWTAFVDRNEPPTWLEYLSLFPLLKKATYVSML